MNLCIGVRRLTLVNIIPIFRYLVHAFNPYARGNALILNNLVTQDEDEAGDQSIDVFKEPGRLDERVSLSMSLIDQNHTATWGGCWHYRSCP